MTDRELSLIAELLPDVRAQYMRYRAHLGDIGIEEMVIKTSRSRAEQQAKFEEGKSSNPVSWHELRRALDRWLRWTGSHTWDSKAANHHLYLKANRLAEAHGFRQIGFTPDDKVRILHGSSGPYTDPYHLERRDPHQTLAAAIAAEAPHLALIAA